MSQPNKKQEANQARLQAFLRKLAELERKRREQQQKKQNNKSK
jgi:hypothetical protein